MHRANRRIVAHEACHTDLRLLRSVWDGAVKLSKPWPAEFSVHSSSSDCVPFCTCNAGEPSYSGLKAGEPGPWREVSGAGRQGAASGAGRQGAASDSDPHGAPCDGG